MEAPWSVLMLAACAAWGGCSQDSRPELEEVGIALEGEPEDSSCPSEVTCYGQPDCPPEVSCFRDKQSRSLQGTLLESLDRTSFHVDSAFWWPDPGPRITRISADETGLVVNSEGTRLADVALNGLTFVTMVEKERYWLRIARVSDPDLLGRNRYHVEQSVADGDDWQSFCAENDSAYVIPAVFLNGGPAEGARDLAFACGRGAVAKAIRWGFAPWEGHTGHFKAAIQLARADYCATGESHTVDGTPVLVQDVDGLGHRSIPDAANPPTVGNAPFFFEAGWQSDSEGSDRPVLCLSKLRWQALPPNPPCANLPDPRVVEGGTFCEELGGRDILAPDFLLNLRRQGALVFSSSQRNDAGLWVWETVGRDGVRYQTTTAGFWGGSSGQTAPPAHGYNVVLNFPSFQGSVLTVDRGPETIPLWQFFDASSGIYRTSIDPRPPGAWSSRKIIGYVYEHAESVPAPFVPVRLRGMTRTVGTVTDYLLISVRTLEPPDGYTDSGMNEGYGFILP